MTKPIKPYQFTPLVILFLSILIPATSAQPLHEHIKGGVPSDEELLVRQGYVMAYSEATRQPRWVAYHITPDYLNTPRRSGRFSSFRVDPDIDNPVRSSDYTWQGYDRGHLAPFNK